MDRLTEMEVFIKVVDAGGFTEAGRRLSMSKSAVSKHVSALEHRLGARLLNRTTRRVSPTEIGLAYYDRAGRVLAEAEEADAMAAAMQGAPRGRLRVSAPLTFGHGYVAPAVAAFLATYPDVSIHLEMDDRFVDLVSQNFDLAIRIGQLADSSLMAKKLGEATMHFIASPEYLAERGEPTAISQLSGHELLHYSNMSWGNYWRLKGASGDERQIRAGGRLSANNGDALVAAAEAGLGIAMQPAFICAEAVRSGRVKEVMPSLRPEPIGIYAVYPPGQYPAPKVRAFIDFMAERFGRDTPPWAL